MESGQKSHTIQESFPEVAMKSYRKTIEVNLPSRMAFLNITPQVTAALRESGIREGLCLVNAKQK